MTISARLNRKTQSLLTRYCQTHGVTQTKAIERGIQLLALQAFGPTAEHHIAWLAYLKIRKRLLPESTRLPGESSGEAVRRNLRTKHHR